MVLLQKGDKIALVAPSGWFKKQGLDNALKWFEKQNLKPVIMPHAYHVDYYAAGTPKERAFDINQAFSNPEIKALFCIRGGAGSLKILDFLDYDLIQKNKKLIFGLSDSTALQNAIYTKTKNPSYTGFLPIYDFKTNTLDSTLEQCLLNIFNSKPISYSGFDVLNSGNVKGTLIGGCLSVFMSLAGTPYFPNLKNKILILEDIGEKTYRLDLMLAQLKMQKNFHQLKAVIFGKFENCPIADEGDGSVQDILQNFAKDVNFPVFYNFNYGHIKSRYILPIGQTIVLKTNCLTIPPHRKKI